MKKCNVCNLEKEISFFDKRNDTKDGRRNTCKKCRSEKSREYYNENKDRILLNIDKERKRKYDSEYRKVYYLKNKDKINDYLRKYYNKIKENPLKRMEINVRSRIRASFSVSKWNKNNKTKEILGCSYEELFLHIQSKFTDGMTWDKIGSEIHIDHIVPISSAKTEGDIIKLNHYTNLQPLWAKDNLIKSNKMNYGNN